ncbi:MAG TPA: 2-oxoacid:ferredoxin oxidoreductase subunit beta [Chloroflexi bacterium]|nr:2-oxoacid:ferredoxin oxidoreductase subunit beta [Chloroflexota bacterium]
MSLTKKTGRRGSTHSIRAYIRTETFPTAFCPGCGHGILMGALLRAIDELELDFEKMLFVSGIGCSGWISSPYFAADTLHTPHGRPIAYATGAKLANPSLKVVVIGGDGDLASIGGNHLIHAARRNIEMTVICANNMIYGMTGGQVTPTTPTGAFTMTTPQGNPDRPFDLCKLVAGAGATYVARYSVYHIRPLIRALKKALTHPGFAFVEVLSSCPTQYGRRNRLGGPSQMLLYWKEKCLPLEKARRMSPEELEGKILIGEFVAPD